MAMTMMATIQGQGDGFAAARAAGPLGAPGGHGCCAPAAEATEAAAAGGVDRPAAGRGCCGSRAVSPSS
jgi:hypothetical protein